MKAPGLAKAIILLAATVGTLPIASASDNGDLFCGRRNVAGRESVEVCQLPIERLLAAPEKYDGKLVRVTGWLVWHNERYVLYGSRDRFLGSAGEGGVPMLGVGLPDEIQERAKTEGGAYGVTIVATFELGPSAKVTGSPGSLKDVVNVYVSLLLRDYGVE